MNYTPRTPNTTQQTVINIDNVTSSTDTRPIAASSVQASDV